MTATRQELEQVLQDKLEAINSKKSEEARSKAPGKEGDSNLQIKERS